MDGTLIDSTEVVASAFVATVRELGARSVDVAAVTAAYALRVPEVILAHLIGRNLNKGESDGFYERLRAAVVHPYAGVHETLVGIYGQWPMGVFTGSTLLSAQILLSRAGLINLVPVLVGGDEIERPKPAPDGILEVCHRLKQLPTGVAYIGDAAVDMAAARAAGAVAVAAGWGHLYSADSSAHVTLTAPHQIHELLARPH